MIGVRQGVMTHAGYEAYLVSEPTIWTWGATEADAVFALVKLLGLMSA